MPKPLDHLAPLNRHSLSRGAANKNELASIKNLKWFNIMMPKTWIKSIRTFYAWIVPYVSNHGKAKLLCISTSKRVLRTPFASQNQFFDAKTTFWIFLSHKMYKITQKNNKNHVLKGGLLAFRCLKINT